MILKVSVLAVVLFSLVGCDKGISNNSNAEARFNHQSLTSKQFANLTNIPEKAEQKREEAFTAFTTRSSVADYLLEGELRGDLSITRRLVDTKSRIVLDAYFKKYLSSVVSDEAIRDYYSKNVSSFSDNEYELFQFQIRVKANDDIKKLSLMADALYKALIEGQQPLDLKKYSAVALEKSLILTSDNTNPSILKALEGVLEGSFSPPVVTKQGIQIFKVKSIKSKPIAFELVKPKIEYKLKQALKQEEYNRLTLIAKK